MRFSDFLTRQSFEYSRISLDISKKMPIAMRHGDDEEMTIGKIDEKSGLLRVKLMALAAFCCLHHNFVTFLHRERFETFFVLLLVFTSDPKL